MRSSIFLAVWLVATSVPLAGQDPAKEKPKTPVPNYYPMEVGNEWKYRSKSKDKTSSITTRITKLDTINGQSLSRLEMFDLTEHLSQTEKGVFRHRMNGAEISPPFQLLAYPPKVGTKWEGESATKKGKFKYSAEIQVEESIEVPAGTFNAIRVAFVVEENGKKTDSVYWFAKDVGFVKQTMEGTGPAVLLELEKFERKK